MVSVQVGGDVYFYPRSPCGERRALACLAGFVCLFLSTLSLRRATSSKTHDRHKTTISIHALLAESDVNGVGLLSYFGNFYPRSPCGERPMGVTVLGVQHHFYPRSPCGERPIAGRIMSKGTKFLSTLSLRRATCVISVQIGRNIHFYPRSPCGERHSARPGTRRRDAISIHALLAESDQQKPSKLAKTSYFYPRSPCGERLRRG